MFHFYKTIFLQKHMKNSHVLQLLEHMDAGPYAFVILDFVILDFYLPLHTQNSCNLSVHKIPYPSFLKITQPVHKKCIQPLHKKSTQPVHKKIKQPLHTQEITQPPQTNKTKITQPLHTQNHANSQQKELRNLSAKKQNYATSPQKIHASSHKKNHAISPPKKSRNHQKK